MIDEVFVVRSNRAVMQGGDMKAGTVLCCGEALIDFLPRETRDGALAFQPYPGGSIFNTAIALGRLDVPAGFLGGLSSDFFGDQLRQSLNESKVDFALSPVSDRYTIMAFVKLFESQARYSFVDEGSAGRMLFEDQLPRLDGSVSALHVGSISIVPEPSGSTIEALCQREARERVISFDPNIRAGLIKDKARHVARIERFMGFADLVKLSDEDLAWIEPGLDPAKAARKWLDLGAKVVTITMGGKGAISFCRGGQAEVSAPQGHVADTVGAGDTFTAGMLTYLHRNDLLSKTAIGALKLDQLGEALSFAARAAAVTVSRPGADPPWSHELA